VRAPRGFQDPLAPHRPLAALTLFFFLHSTLSPAVAFAAGSTAEHHSTAPEHLTPTDTNTDATAAPSAATDPSVATATEGATHPTAHTPDVPTDDAANTTAVRPSTGDTTTNKAKTYTAVGTASGTDTVGTPGEASTLSLPGGADKSGVTSKAISLPQGSGKIAGMGESFSAQLSTGIATFSVPFALPKARGGAQPSLALSYSSSGGFGEAGVGWSVGVPFIARQTDRGVPSYQDGTAFDINQDRFVFNGGQELVPICVVGDSGVCNGSDGNSALPAGEVMPAWAEGSMYFRPRVEGSYLRFFFASDHRTWRVQDKSGVTMELGVPLDGSSDTGALESDPNDSGEVYRWYLTRQYDTYGTANPSTGAVTPVNVVLYKYLSDGGSLYVSDIFDTPPVSNPTTNATSLFAHHTHLSYEQRTDPTVSYRAGFPIEQNLRLTGVDVASQTFTNGSSGTRRQVHRYHLSYESGGRGPRSDHAASTSAV
jgi:hypothetical protein